MPSRLDHILVDPDLLSSIERCGVGPTRPDSDHMPLDAHPSESCGYAVPSTSTCAAARPNMDLE